MRYSRPGGFQTADERVKALACQRSGLAWLIVIVDQQSCRTPSILSHKRAHHQTGPRAQFFSPTQNNSLNNLVVSPLSF
jgi:hypothetical protein